jgi:hypothetical protein
MPASNNASTPAAALAVSQSHRLERNRLTGTSPQWGIDRDARPSWEPRRKATLPAVPTMTGRSPYRSPCAPQNRCTREPGARRFSASSMGLGLAASFRGKGDGCFLIGSRIGLSGSTSFRTSEPSTTMVSLIALLLTHRRYRVGVSGKQMGSMHACSVCPNREQSGNNDHRH